MTPYKLASSLSPSFKYNIAKILNAGISSDAALTIADVIESKRANAMLGGGQKRIDSQHKKVG